MLNESSSIAFANFKTEAYNGLVRHIQSLQMKVPRERGRQKKKKKKERVIIGYSHVSRKHRKYPCAWAPHSMRDSR